MSQSMVNTVPEDVKKILDDNDAYNALPAFNALPVGTIAWAYVCGEVYRLERVATKTRGGRGLNLGHNARKLDGRRGHVYVMGNGLVEAR